MEQATSGARTGAVQDVGAAGRRAGDRRSFAPPVRLLGRDDLRAALGELVAAGTIVTAIGPGGVGKTSLAASVVADRRAAGQTVHVGLLAPLPAGASSGAVADALGFESPEAAAVVLAESPALLVMDNCEHVLDGVRELLEVVVGAVPGASVLATSREPLGVAGEQVTVVPPLDLPPPGGADAERSPAVELFLERAGAAGAVLVPSPRQLADVGELCRRLDGLPLAIELAAARSRALAPGDLLEMVDHRLDVLRRRRPAGRRHDSMQAAIDVSIDMLTAEERDLFHRLSVFQGPFDLHLAHAVAGAPGSPLVETLDGLSSLVDRSLLVTEHGPGPVRYRLLELLRERAAVGLGPELPAVEERFVEAMTDVADELLASALERWTPEVLARASGQFTNLSRAVELCVERRSGRDRCFRLVVPMFAAVHEGRAHEVAALGERLLACWPDPPAPLRAEALAVLATASALAGRLDAVADLAAAAIADPDATAIAVALAERAWAFATRPGDPEAGVTHLRAARSAADEAGFDAVSRELQALEAGETDLAGRRDDALGLVDDLVTRCATDGDLFVAILAHLIRARIWIRAGAVEPAQAELDAATAASEAIEQLWWNAAILRTRASLASLGPGGFGAAAGEWRGAVDFAASRGALGEVAITLRAAATVAQHVGSAEAAATLFSAAPRGGAITVLPELFPDALAELDATVPPAAPGTNPVELLARARRALADAAAVATPPVGAATAEPAEHAPAAPAPDPEPRPEWVREGDVWRLAYGGTEVRVRNRKGVADLAVLLASPGFEHPALTLMGGADVGGSAGADLDERARREYRDRIVELQRAVDEAREHNDPVRAERAEAELDELVATLSAAFGLGGRSRSTGSSTERARSAVTARIRAAIDAIDEVHPTLARHLRNAVRTGTWCSYHPEEDPGWVVADHTS